MTINILMHKSWHVWNRDNQEKVERDEAKHAEKLKEERLKEIEADNEARYERITKRTEKTPVNNKKEEEKNVNFFEEIEKQEKLDHMSKKKKREPTNEEKKELAKNFFTEDSMKTFNNKLAVKQWYEEDTGKHNLAVQKPIDRPYHNPNKFRNLDDPMMMMDYWAPSQPTTTNQQQRFPSQPISKEKDSSNDRVKKEHKDKRDKKGKQDKKEKHDKKEKRDKRDKHKKKRKRHYSISSDSSSSEERSKRSRHK
jgi:hypothetical protein